MKFSLDMPARDHVVVVTDKRVGSLYADDLITELKQQHPKVNLLTITGDEACKNQHTKADLERQLFDLGADRQILLIALGGGVVGDMTGFVAATYMRGIDYVQVPTTLLAMVDSSIGGKTGVNTDYGKNLIGAIWHPVQIVRRPELLRTLDDEQFVNGLIEVVKIFLTCDAASLSVLNKALDRVLARDMEVLEPLINRAIELKEEIVSRDEREKGERAILNFGHTVGHGFELLSDYQLLHGFAVGMGIWVEACMARTGGHLGKAEFVILRDLLNRLGIESTHCKNWTSDQVWAAMKHDKKAGKNQINYVVLAGVGRAHHSDTGWIQPMDQTTFALAYQEFLAG